MRRYNRQMIVCKSFEFIDRRFFYGKLNLHGSTWFGDDKDNHTFTHSWGWETNDEFYQRSMRK
jgi:hypothetical protein